METKQQTLAKNLNKSSKPADPAKPVNWERWDKKSPFFTSSPSSPSSPSLPPSTSSSFVSSLEKKSLNDFSLVILKYLKSIIVTKKIQDKLGPLNYVLNSIGKDDVNRLLVLYNENLNNLKTEDKYNFLLNSINSNLNILKLLSNIPFFLSKDIKKNINDLILYAKKNNYEKEENWINNSDYKIVKNIVIKLNGLMN